MVQANRSEKQAGALVVGLHYHLRQADYWYVAARAGARVVLHDLRRGPGPTGRLSSIDLDGAVDRGCLHPAREWRMASPP